MPNIKKIICLIFCIIYFSMLANSKERIYIDNGSKTIENKEAILILVGFGSKIQGTKEIASYFFNKGYDIFIPDYISRSSILNSVENLNNFILTYKLKQYKKIHVFSYIIGSWTLNNWIYNNPKNNIESIIYDRSPLQERAPYALIKDYKYLISIVFGNIMKEFSTSPYPPIIKNKINIGLIIESTPTKLIIKHKKSTLSLGPINWNVKSLNQEYTDFFYINLNHDEMYKRFDISGNEIMNFIKYHKFTDSAKRSPYNENSFIK